MLKSATLHTPLSSIIKMGIDIHAFIEAKQNQESPIYYCLASFHLSRDYQLFDILGNGRNYHSPRSEWETKAFLESRGAPKDMSVLVARELYDIVISSSNPQQNEYPNHSFWEKDKCILYSVAEQRIKETKAFWGEVRQTFNIEFKCCPNDSEWATWKTISKPYLHSVSYLQYDEIIQALKANTIHIKQLPNDYVALLDYFKTLIDSKEYYDIRLVFWFDY